ncbi:MAG: twin-arginine translocation signal domain-containing protein [Planctomycetes bacterium]|nr:twin-arginine translocation signal domain-containing protein [Planctomycetota bacterium]
MSRFFRISRRDFLSQAGSTAGAVALGLAGSAAPGAEPRSPGPLKKPKVAAIFTELRFRSHAFNFLENFLGPYLFNGKLTEPAVEVVSFHADQFPPNDLAREVSRRFQIPLYGSIDQALCLGGQELAVDAVLSIVEHGEYPTNPRGQRMYPRKEFFDATVAVMKRSGHFVPFFNDKHLSYRWDWAKEMYDTAKRLGIPLMAGSSVPLAERRPPLEIPPGAVVEEAVAVHGGGVEVYDFHGLELLQSVIESRTGGETGISQVEFIEGDDFRRAAEGGRWSRELADAAMAAELGRPPASYDSIPGDRQEAGKPAVPASPHALLVTYKDGLRAAVLKVGRNSSRWNFVCRLQGEAKVRATRFYNGPWGNRNLFKALSHAVQWFFVHRRAPYPVERTLLVSGALDDAMTSREKHSRPVATPHLEFSYEADDFHAFREMGATWQIITSATPEKKGFDPGDHF